MPTQNPQPFPFERFDPLNDTTPNVAPERAASANVVQNASANAPQKSLDDANLADAAKLSATEIEERHAQHLLDKAFLLWEKNDVAGAIVACRQSIHLSPDSAGAHSMLGLLLERAGDAAGAIAAYDKAVEIEPASLLERDSARRLRASQPQSSAAIFHFQNDELFDTSREITLPDDEPNSNEAALNATAPNAESSTRTSNNAPISGVTNVLSPKLDASNPATPTAATPANLPDSAPKSSTQSSADAPNFTSPPSSSTANAQIPSDVNSPNSDAPNESSRANVRSGNGTQTIPAPNIIAPNSDATVASATTISAVAPQNSQTAISARTPLSAAEITPNAAFANSSVSGAPKTALPQNANSANEVVKNKIPPANANLNATTSSTRNSATPNVTTPNAATAQVGAQSQQVRVSNRGASVIDNSATAHSLPSTTSAAAPAVFSPSTFSSNAALSAPIKSRAQPNFWLRSLPLLAVGGVGFLFLLWARGIAIERETRALTSQSVVANASQNSDAAASSNANPQDAPLSAAPSANVTNANVTNPNGVADQNAVVNSASNNAVNALNLPATTSVAANGPVANSSTQSVQNNAVAPNNAPVIASGWVVSNAPVSRDTSARNTNRTARNGGETTRRDERNSPRERRVVRTRSERYEPRARRYANNNGRASFPIVPSLPDVRSIAPANVSRLPRVESSRDEGNSGNGNSQSNGEIPAATSDNAPRNSSENAASGNNLPSFPSPVRTETQNEMRAPSAENSP